MTKTCVVTAAFLAASLSGCAALRDPDERGVDVDVPAHYFGRGRSGDFNRIQAFAQRFDFDLVGLVACSLVTREYRNLRPMGWITYLGDRVWLGDVDEADSLLTLTIMDPGSRRVATSATGRASWGDTTTAVDDWRSPDYVRQGSFDRALDNLLSNLVGASYALEPRANQ